jgi:peptidyl-tRNA hydrolase, PTH2 family
MSEFGLSDDPIGRRTKQVIVMRKDLGMRKGKMIAQGAHAAMVWLIDPLREGKRPWFSEAESEWINGGITKVCVGVDSERELLAVHQAAQTAGIRSTLITDAGLTEFGGVPTTTCLAIGPDWNEKVDAITGALKLL